MVTGRARMPSHLKVLEGNRGKRPLNQFEPKPPPEPPKKPDTLSPAAGAIWDDLVEQLSGMRVLASVDGYTLETLCAPIVIHREAAVVVAEEGVVTRGVRGTIVKNPAVQVMRDAATTICLLASEFGLTPSGRTRIEVPRPFERELYT